MPNMSLVALKMHDIAAVLCVCGIHRKNCMVYFRCFRRHRSTFICLISFLFSWRYRIPAIDGTAKDLNLMLIVIVCCRRIKIVTSTAWNYRRNSSAFFFHVFIAPFRHNLWTNSALTPTHRRDKMNCIVYSVTAMLPTRRDVWIISTRKQK